MALFGLFGKKVPVPSDWTHKPSKRIEVPDDPRYSALLEKARGDAVEHYSKTREAADKAHKGALEELEAVQKRPAEHYDGTINTEITKLEAKGPKFEAAAKQKFIAASRTKYHNAALEQASTKVGNLHTELTTAEENVIKVRNLPDKFFHDSAMKQLKVIGTDAKGAGKILTSRNIGIAAVAALAAAGTVAVVHHNHVKEEEQRRAARGMGGQALG